MQTIKKTRASLGITQARMGKMLGMSGDRVSEIERGVRTETKQMKKHLESINTLVKIVGPPSSDLTAEITMEDDCLAGKILKNGQTIAKEFYPAMTVWELQEMLMGEICSNQD